jgi:predicted metal-binding protein
MRTNDPQILHEEITGAHLDQFIHKAISLGASEAAIIASKDISVEDSLANRCVDPKCIYYGLSPSCPPHVAGPSEFRNLQKTHTHAIVVRIIVPSASLFSDQSKEIMRLLHEVVSSIEHEAVKAGFSNAKAFAGGSCKMVFCNTHLECQRLSKDGQCRNPKYARPSMSGFGVNVNDLIKKCGWRPNLNTEKTKPDDKMSWVAGLIMIG